MAEGGESSSNVIVRVYEALARSLRSLMVGYDGANFNIAKVNSNGSIDVNVASGGGTNSSVSATGAAVPSNATFVGGTDGTNLRGILVDSTGRPLVVVKQDASETTASQNLATGSLSKTTAASGAFRLVSVGIKFSAAVSQTVQVVYSSPNGSNYNFILDSSALATNTSYFAFWDNLVFLSGGQITVTCTNTLTPAVTAYLTITTVPV